MYLFDQIDVTIRADAQFVNIYLHKIFIFNREFHIKTVLVT